MSSVVGRVRTRLGHDGVAPSRQRGEEDRGLHLGARHGHGVVDAAQRRRAPYRKGAWQCPWPETRAPISASGAATRSIGRCDSDASPTSRASPGIALTTPASRRIEVPEFAAVQGARRWPAALVWSSDRHDVVADARVAPS